MSITRTSLTTPAPSRATCGNRRGNAKAPRHARHRAEAHFVAQLRRNGVLGIGKGGADIDLIRHKPPPELLRAPAVDCHWLVHHLRIGRIACLQRRQIDEQLPRRARLAHRIGGAVVVGSHVIRAADHRQHRAIAVKADQRALRSRGTFAWMAPVAACCCYRHRAWSTPRSVRSLSGSSRSSCGRTQSVK